MSDPNASTTDNQTTAVSVVDHKPKAPRLIATSDVAIWDTAALDHMGRVGRLMADSGLASETIFKDGDQPAEDHTVVARMVMIANLARECGANPLMFLQGCSIIGRKLHLEGKIVNAVIRARTGLVLCFTFGVWNTDHIEFPPMIPKLDAAGEHVMGEDGKPAFVADQTFFHGAGERLAVRVSDPDDPERFVDGSVGLWKTDRKGSPWTAQGNWRRQLRYRGAPEWARAYEPGAILGFYSDADEDLDDIDTAPRGPKPKRDLKAKLTNQGHDGEHGAEGFDHQGIADSLGGGAKAEAVEVERGDLPHDPETGEVLDGEFTEATAPRPGEDGHIPAGETEDATDGDEGVFSAELMASAEQLARISPHDEEVEVIAARLSAADEAAETVAQGHAEPGEKYLIAGEAFGADGRRLAYKDGSRFSGVKSVAGLKVYAIHAPAPEVAETATEAAPEPQIGVVGFRNLKTGAVKHGGHPGEGWEPIWGDIDTGQEIPGAGPTTPAALTETATAPVADVGPASSASATPASTTTAAVTSSPGAPAAASSGSEPEDDTFLGRLKRATTWAEVKAEYGPMNRTAEWMAASEADRDELRRAVWAEVERIKRDHGDKVDHATDVSAFGIWLATQTGRDGAYAAKGTLECLKGVAIWGQLTAAQRQLLEDRVTAKLKAAGIE